MYPIKYLGAVQAKQNVPITSASILADFPTATVIKMKTEGVRVQVDGTAMFDIEFNDEHYLETGQTFMFNKDCIVALGIYKVVT